MKEIDTNIDSENIITTASQDNEIIRKKSTEEVEEVDQDKVQAILEDIKAEFTSVSSVLSPTEQPLREKDLFDVIKFTIKLKLFTIMNGTYIVSHQTSKKISKKYLKSSKEII